MRAIQYHLASLPICPSIRIYPQLRGGLADRPTHLPAPVLKPLRNALRLRKQIVAQERKDGRDSLDRWMCLATFPMTDRRARYPELGRCPFLIEPECEPAFPDMVTQRLGFEVSLPPSQALEPKRDGLQKSNATLHVRFRGTGTRDGPLKRRRRRTRT